MTNVEQESHVIRLGLQRDVLLQREEQTGRKLGLWAGRLARRQSNSWKCGTVKTSQGCMPPWREARMGDVVLIAEQTPC